MATKETHAATAAPTPDTPLRPTHPDVRVGVVRRNSESGVDQFDTVEWEVRDAIIPGKDGPSFEQRARRVPDDVVADGHEHRGAEVLPREARRRPSASAPCAR